MRINDKNYTVEVRKVINQGVGKLYVFNGRGGEAFLSEYDTIVKDIGDKFELDDELIKILRDLARTGCVVRYYSEEGRISAHRFYQKP